MEDDTRSLQPQSWLVLGAVGQGRTLSSPIHPPGMVEVIPERCVPIAKKELMYMGTVGWACWLSGIIFIDRHKREDAIDVICQTARTMRRENVRGAGSKHRWAKGGAGRTDTAGARVLWLGFISLPVLCSSECSFSLKAPGTRTNPCCPSSAGLSTWPCRLR